MTTPRGSDVDDTAQYCIEQFRRCRNDLDYRNAQAKEALSAMYDAAYDAARAGMSTYEIARATGETFPFIERALASRGKRVTEERRRTRTRRNKPNYQ